MKSKSCDHQRVLTRLHNRRASSGLLRASCAIVTVLWASNSFAAPVKIDLSEEHQTMDGFGFFGAKDVWWASGGLISDDWAELVIDDLGITIWRNEYYPPGDSQNGQDADWVKQKPVALGLAAAAAAHDVQLKTIVTVWTPPASMKCARDDANAPIDGTPNPGGTKGGGALCPSQTSPFATWLTEGIQQYADAGLNVYALSFQNEPLFEEEYNSCVYNYAYYADTLAAVAPKVRQTFPQLKFFGAENMLAMEGGTDRQWFYSTAIQSNPAALKELDIWAVHGYADGVLPTASSAMATLWTNFKTDFSAPSAKPTWMTETSGYNDTWNDGAMQLGQAIYAALAYGDVSGWVWWQGSSSETSDYGLMVGTTELSKRYYVHKQFARFIRPGAKRVTLQTDDSELFALAFRHDALDNFVVVALNPTDKEKTLDLTGKDLPSAFESFVTNETINCESQGEVTGTSLKLPPHSIATFVSGSVYEADLPISGDSDGGNGKPTDASSGTDTSGGGNAGATGTTTESSETTSTSTSTTDSPAPGTSNSTTSTASSDSDSTDKQKSGCGCRSAASGNVPASGGLAALLLGAFALYRRRRAVV